MPDFGPLCGYKIEQEDKYLPTVFLNIVLATKVHFIMEQFSLCGRVGVEKIKSPKSKQLCINTSLQQCINHSGAKTPWKCLYSDRGQFLMGRLILRFYENNSI